MTHVVARSFLVDKARLSRWELQQWQVDESALRPGQVLLRVERFAFTANNVTYAAMGDAMQYWRFFPAPSGMGCIPVWGFADVQASRCEGVEPGERFYGYYPMSTHSVVQPDKVASQGFVDAAEHRSELPVIYNQYLRCARDPLYPLASEDLQMLLRPLFTTSFLLDDFFADHDFFGARCMVLTSASSKTALGLAHLLRGERARRPRHYEIVGLTSSGNRDFVSARGLYDRVLRYDQLPELDGTQPTAYVDFAGNGATLAALHHHFGSALRYACLVGLAHWDQRGGLAKDLPGPKPQMFFAPTQAAKRVKEWGGATFQQRLAEHWQGFSAAAAGWLRVEYAQGASAVAAVYQQVLAGRADPQVGHVMSLADDFPA
jgi:hypothetical protein